jgi:hypothetical protein
MNAATSREARAAWERGDVLRAGRLLHPDLPIAERPKWAARVLAAACGDRRLPRELRRVLDIAADPSRWREAHDVFTAVRLLTLEQEKAGAGRDRKLEALLYLAENTAKVIYNATGAPAPFDAACGERIARNAKACLDADPRSEPSEAIEAALFRDG